MFWMKDRTGFKTIEEAREYANEHYLSNPYIADYYIEKSRKLYHIIALVDMDKLRNDEVR